MVVGGPEAGGDGKGEQLKQLFGKGEQLKQLLLNEDHPLELEARVSYFRSQVKDFL